MRNHAKELAELIGLQQPSKTSGSPPACARSPGWSRCQSVSYAYMDGRQNLRQTVEERGFKLG
jgi:hypothetical protein